MQVGLCNMGGVEWALLDSEPLAELSAKHTHQAQYKQHTPFLKKAKCDANERQTLDQKVSASCSCVCTSKRLSPSSCVGGLDKPWVDRRGGETKVANDFGVKPASAMQALRWPKALHWYMSQDQLRKSMKSLWRDKCCRWSPSHSKSLEDSWDR